MEKTGRPAIWYLVLICLVLSGMSMGSLTIWGLRTVVVADPVRESDAYEQQARGRSERSFGTWQGRLPQELRVRGIKTVASANAFLRKTYIDEFNQRFTVAAAQKGSAFVRCPRRDLDLVFSLQHERTVNQDNTVSYENRILQIGKSRWTNTLAGCTVVVHEQADGVIVIRYGPHEVARIEAGASTPTRSPRKRKAGPKARHEGFQQLPEPDKQVVSRLAPLLRLADSLDRSHEQRIEQMECRLRDDSVVLFLISGADTDLDQWAAQRASEFFDETYGRPVALVKAP